MLAQHRDTKQFSTDVFYETSDVAVSIPTEIQNARIIEPGDYDACGFRLINHSSQVTNWGDLAGLESIHVPELESLAKELVGCDYALVGAFVRRNPELEKQHQHLMPVGAAHADFAASFGEQLRAYFDEPRYSTFSDRAKRAMGTLEQAGLDQATFKNARRLVILQFWRNVGSPDMDYPLALCDTRTVPFEKLDTIMVENFSGSSFMNFETLRVKPPDLHHNYKWYTYPEMTTDELLVFRGLDTDLVKEEKPFWTPHAAFKNPYSTAQTPRRRSVEVRVTCVFV